MWGEREGKVQCSSPNTETPAPFEFRLFNFLGLQILILYFTVLKLRHGKHHFVYCQICSPPDGNTGILRFVGTFEVGAPACLEMISLRLCFAFFSFPCLLSLFFLFNICLCGGKRAHLCYTPKMLCITFVSKTHFHWAWLHTPLILALQKQRQEDL